MKRNLVFVLCCLFSFGLFGQKLKTVKKNFRSAFPAKEIYQVLKSDKSVRHGSYALKNSSHTILEGQYIDNEASGILTCYASKEEVYYKYDYDHDSLVYFSPDRLEDFVDPKFDTPAVFTYGYIDLLSQLYSNLKYPAEAYNKGISGTVFLELTLGKDGRIGGAEVRSSSSELLEEAALQSIEAIQTKVRFMAASQNGEKVDAVILLPVKFKQA